ncbi:unnamed protein product [Phyllotreta striolata]|uniref:Insulin-like domain-containing protein n=1 Tax=Phyllotreta striolata TaxID=444603 RepID=A0A9N9XMQ0_PHYSR|nr:unnamed protein product [Phyllotreta striolata]
MFNVLQRRKMYYCSLVFLLSYICCVVLAFDSAALTEVDKTARKRAFCGRRLTTILGHFCLEFPDRDNDTPSRSKRQIVKECCTNKCSLNYLLENYCQTVNTEALEAFKREDDSQELFSHKQITDNISTTPGTSEKTGKKLRKRRNCSCRKRLKLKKLQLEIKFWRSLVNGNFAKQEAQIGEIEFQQHPFYLTF